MKELFKYLLISVLYVLIIAMVAVDVIAQPELEEIRYNFSGEKTRFVFDLTSPAEYTITEDWLDNRVVIFLEGVNHKDIGRFQTGKWKNYIIENCSLSRTSGGLELNIETKHDYKVKYSSLTNGHRLVFDVYPRLDKPDLDTLIKRAQVYKKRGNSEKAAVLFKSVYEQDPENAVFDNGVKTLFGLVRPASNTINDKGTAEETESLVKSIKEDKVIPIKAPDNLDEAISPAAEIKSDEDDQTEIIENEKPIISGPEIKDQVKTENPVNDLVVNKGQDPTEDPEVNKEPSVLVDVEELIKESGVQNVVLYSLYGILFVLLTIVLLLIKRLIKAYRKPKKKSRRISHILPDKLIARKPVSKRNPANAKKQEEDIRSFARRLTELYSKTETTAVKTEQRKQEFAPTENNQILEHTKKIEEVFASERGLMPDDFEALRLIRQYKENNINSVKSPDKYLVVRQLAAQNWEAWEIARELSLGIEEVKMAMTQGGTAEQIKDSDDKHDKIYLLNDMHFSTHEIASRLQMDEEQVRLALKLRKGIEKIENIG